MEKKKEFSIRLKQWRKTRGFTQEELAEKAGVAQKTISAYENARIFVSYDAAKRLGEALDISPLYLFCETDDPHEHLKKKPESNAEILPLSNQKIVPIFESASAGIGAEPLSEPIGYVQLMPDEEGDFILTIKGNSMEPKLYEGDRVLVNKSIEIKNNDTVIALVDGVVYCKVYYKDPDGRISLYSHAREYAPIRQNGEIQFEIIGKVVGYYAKML
jgi:repressor LexA